MSEFERPIQSFEEDSLGRLSFVRRLASALINTSTKKSTGLTLGIAGPWGSGKSSILNLLQRELQSEQTAPQYGNPIIIRFDPWLISSRNDLISYFFYELEAKIKESGTNHPAVREATKKIIGKFAEYASALTPAAALVGMPIPGVDRILALIGQKIKCSKISRKNSR